MHTFGIFRYNFVWTFDFGTGRKTKYDRKHFLGVCVRLCVDRLFTYSHTRRTNGKKRESDLPRRQQQYQPKKKMHWNLYL